MTATEYGRTGVHIVRGSDLDRTLTIKSIYKSGPSERTFILSPMATLTEYQGKGVGQKLINYGLETLKTDGVELLLAYGDPNFYSNKMPNRRESDIIQMLLDCISASVMLESENSLRMGKLT